MQLAAGMRVALAVLIAGCGFTGHTPEGGSSPDAGAPGEDVLRSCKAPPEDVRLCIDFEDASLAERALDGSGQGHDAVATGITAMQRLNVPVPEQAAQLATHSNLHVGETAALDLAALTIEMWIRPDAIATAGLLDNFGQYSMEITSDGKLRCGLGAQGSTDSDSPLDAGAWHHVACRFDGEQLKVYADGNVVACEDHDPTTTLPAAGTAIGARFGVPGTPVLGFRDSFVGGLDNVRVYSGAIDEARLCTASGAAVCKTACPKGGHDGGRP